MDTAIMTVIVAAVLSAKTASNIDGITLLLYCNAPRTDVDDYVS